MTSTERRSAILQAASRLFEHYGHGKTTIADVAREAQVGVGTVYLEFESKEAIVAELSLSTHAGVLEAMRAASRKTEDYAERLTAVLMTRTECFLQLRKKGQHACELVHCKTDGVRAAHQRFRDQEQTLLEVILHEGQRVGSFDEYEPSSTAALIQHAFACLSPPWIFALETDAMRICSDLCQLLLHGLMSASAAEQSRALPLKGSKRPGPSSSRKPARSR